MSDGMGRELAYLSSHATNRYFIPNWGIKYYPANGDNRLLNATLFDIFSCEEDLASHNRVEDYLFVPAIMELEKRDNNNEVSR